MRTKVILYLAVLGFLSCNSAITPPDFFKQLPGKWQRTNDELGLRTFEIWEQEAGTITGIAYTLEGKDTVFKENLRLIEKNENWFLEVKAPGEAPVPFEIINYSQNNLTAENSENEYPKKVVYSFKNDTLTATISGGGPTEPYRFIKKQ